MTNDIITYQDKCAINPVPYHGSIWTGPWAVFNDPIVLTKQGENQQIAIRVITSLKGCVSVSMGRIWILVWIQLIDF